MSARQAITIESPALLEFRGPDAQRFLNGQVTQDVRKLAGGKISLPACVTDAKGKLQFRVWITESPDGVLWVEGPAGTAEALEARLTRYLIADDVEVTNLTGMYALVHFIGEWTTPPRDVIARESSRFGKVGADWWSLADAAVDLPLGTTLLLGEEFEAFRIANKIPQWGSELIEGILPPEAGLDQTDISYQKGCYVGQEVISRIKSAGKVNQRLVQLRFDAAIPISSLSLVDEKGSVAGRLTSISPIPEGSHRLALGYLKRGVQTTFVQLSTGKMDPAEHHDLWNAG